MAFDSYFHFFLSNVKTYGDKKDTDNSGRNNGVWRDKGEDEKGMGEERKERKRGESHFHLSILSYLR